MHVGFSPAIARRQSPPSSFSKADQPCISLASGLALAAEKLDGITSSGTRYLPPPTTRNFGFATTILAGSDQDICCAPVGSA
jgi:hypothetical protein